ncbi:hypothetical protein HNQ77_001774 [Silvibacterium bohemicum]|uniref:Uncharacterized protein n=1 Tax=Silvibacterium bohemicum TaxID=1577686 RepID=A0A841JTJ7_9BACT|nr:hypothetical protein [Silvibacterium bohemicum]
MIKFQAVSGLTSKRTLVATVSITASCANSQLTTLRQPSGCDLTLAVPDPALRPLIISPSSVAGLNQIRIAPPLF